MNSFSQKRVRDSVYYVKYRDRLIVSVFQSYRYYNVSISQTGMKDSLAQSKLSYQAEASHITGLELNYDKFNIAVGFKSNSSSQQSAKGNTKYTNLMFNVGGNEWVWENSYRRYKGFYDLNTSHYDTLTSKTGNYTKLPLLESQAYKMRFMFFTNHNKFSFKSGYSCSYRQVRTAASFVLTGNIYYNRLNSDSSFIPYQVRSYYGNFADINGLNVFAFSVYGGGSANFVIWKSLFLNLTLVIGPEEQWRTYHYLGSASSTSLNYLSISGDFRASFGLNYHRFFILLSGTNDFSWYNNNRIDVLSKYASVNFSLGYRFNMKPTKLYQKLQQTKLYKLL
ncbi:MAG: DUF4421 family protein [Bacteroidetes bacterium]|nr:DUF4421 family protein [Bacteroidota bacterium]